jgi:hypothetical protein
MNRIFMVIVVALFLTSIAVPVPLHAQHRFADGGGTAHAGSARPAPAHSAPMHPPNSFAGRPVTPPVMPFVNPPVSVFGRSPAFGASRPFGRHSRPAVAVPTFVPAFGYGYGYYPYDYYSPFAGPVSIAPDPITEQNYGYVPPAADVPPVSQNEADLSYEVGRLSQEIEELRQQQAMQAQPVPPAPAAASPAASPMVLIFRDGRRMEIQNYAIIGQTLWVLDDHNSTKIPLSDLDLEATRQQNGLRGLRFSVPGK